jgi:glycosyltransferase involved in cell wall biosynthesis
VRWALADRFVRLVEPMLRGSSVHLSWQRESGWRSRQRASSGAIGTAWDAATSAADLWLFSPIDWAYRRQRPQHLACELARRGHRVLCLSPEFVDGRDAGFSVERVDDLPVYSVRLNARGRPSINRSPISAELEGQLFEGLDACGRSAGVRDALSIVQHPSWLPLARRAARSGLVYDWLDDHAAFRHVGDHVLGLQAALIAEADLVVASARSLEERARALGARNVVRVPNGAEVEHFRARPAARPRYADGRKVIGYFGAVSDWLDVELLRAVANRFRDCQVVLIGTDEAGVWWRLRDCSNVLGLAEVPYAELPIHLHAMDVCLVPFDLTPLTLATNPVKVYEYLAAAKPVVATALPELRAPEFEGLIHLAGDREAFLERVSDALEEDDAELRQRRREFAAASSWPVRAAVFDDALSRSCGGRRAEAVAAGAGARTA